MKIKKVNEVQCLLLSSSIDFSTDLVCHELEARKVKYLRLNRDTFNTYSISFDVEKDTLFVGMDEKDYQINSDCLKSVWFRAPVFLRSGKMYSLYEQMYRTQWNAFIRNLIVFDTPIWVNHPVATYRAENKTFQLKLAKKHGLLIPETHVGNSLREIKDLCDDGLYVIKSLDTALFYDGKHELFTYSNVITGSELKHTSICDAPIILQKYLPEKLDIRVTYIGKKVFPVQILKNGKGIEGDWRISSKTELSYKPIELPEDITAKLCALMDELNLSFGGIDLIYSNNKYYFIEVNPTGEWSWLQSNTNLPLANSIVDLLEVPHA